MTVYAASGSTVERSSVRLTAARPGSSGLITISAPPQCFYDIAVAVDPTNADRVYLGGSPALRFGFSINGGTTFTTNAATLGLHVDSHAIAVAPSLPSTIYFGSDGGIYKSTNSGTNWTVLNNTQYFATQFMSLALHPIDRGSYDRWDTGQRHEFLINQTSSGRTPRAATAGYTADRSKRAEQQRGDDVSHLFQPDHCDGLFAEPECRAGYLVLSSVADLAAAARMV